MTPPSAPGSEARVALLAGIGCYLIWGFVPLVFQAIGALGVGPWEILAHRTVWGTPTALVFVLLAGQWRQVVRVFSNRKVLGWLTVSAALIATNWSVFIWAVTSGRVLESSLGYYITPLLNMAAGALLFRERIDRIGAIAIALAVVGVAVQTAAIGHLPLVSLALGLSFGAYGVVRKQVNADAQTGLFIECLLLAGPGLAFVLWLASQGQGHFTASPQTTLWLLASGPVTAVPLVLFSWCARRLPLSLMGFMQFIGPTIGIVIGVVEGEAFGPLRAASFVFIWSGAAVFAWGAWKRSRPELRATAMTEPAE
ncbi:MAG: EamA family transporter RarD [Phenylobacterium sp.]